MAAFPGGVRAGGGADRGSLARYTAGLPFAMPIPSLPAFPERTVRITDHGAVPDGQTLNTAAFERALRACAEAGGGTVAVPAGTWLTGPVRLRSGVNLHLERGALLMFSKRFDDYPVVFSKKGKRYRCTPPLWGEDLHDVAVTGDGVIDGGGEAWRPVKREKQTEKQWKELLSSGGAVTPDGKIWWPSKEALEGEDLVGRLRARGGATADDYRAAREFLRPALLELVGCRRVLLDGPTFRNSPWWNVHLLQSEDIVVRDVTILNPWYAQNGDGLDLGSCRTVIVADVTVDAGDDAICLKPGTLGASQRPGPACENIVVADCIVYRGHGAFVIGSESYGGARNIAVRNCTFIGTDVGLRFKSSRDRGGTVEKVFVDGIAMRDIVNEAVLFDMSYGEGDPAEETEAAPITERTPRFQDFSIRNVVCSGSRRGLVMRGLPEMPLRRIALDSVVVSFSGGALCAEIDGLALRGLRLATAALPALTLRDCRNAVIAGPGLPDGPGEAVAVAGEKTDAVRFVVPGPERFSRRIGLGRGVRAEAVQIGTE